jgi:hypothetical protein
VSDTDLPNPTPEALAAQLRQAIAPLIALRDAHLDVEEMLEIRSDHPGWWRRAAAEHLDQAFDEIDAVIRILEDPEDK